MNRPFPSSKMLARSELSDFGISLTPAPEVWEWLQAEILSDTGSIHNEDHAHLLDADIRVMWASSSFEKQGRTVLGQAEQVSGSTRPRSLCRWIRLRRMLLTGWTLAKCWSRPGTAQEWQKYWLALRKWIETNPDFPDIGKRPVAPS